MFYILPKLTFFHILATPSMTNIGLGGSLPSTLGGLEGSQTSSTDSGKLIKEQFYTPK